MTHARFSIIPGWIVTDPRLKGRDLQVLCLLGRYTDKAGWCVRSQVKMAGQLNCARSTVQLSLDRLVSIGAVEKRAGESRDGRDTSYWYRVIYDRAVAAEEMAAWDDDEGAEALANDSYAGDSGAQAPADMATPPADISAPPADPGSAPPADPASAPYKNDPHITAQAERNEREARARGCDSGFEDGRAAERAFKRTFPRWPTYVGDSEEAARRAWLALSPDERAAAAERIDDYLAAAKAGGRKTVCSFGVYLTEKRWEKLPEREAEPVATHHAEAPFGKGWGALRFVQLLREPGPMPSPTRFIQGRIEAGGPDGERERLAHQARHGWPIVNAMHANAAERRGFRVAVEDARLGENFRQVKRGTVLWDAWAALHQRRGWPWLPIGPGDGGPDWVWMPPGEDPEAAMAEFQKAVQARDAENDDGEDRAAAE